MKTLDEQIMAALVDLHGNEIGFSEATLLIKAAFVAHLPRPKEYAHNTIDLQGYAYDQALIDIKKMLLGMK